MNLDQLCAAAQKRVAEHINRVSGQHMRAIRKAFAEVRKEQERRHVTHG